MHNPQLNHLLQDGLGQLYTQAVCVARQDGRPVYSHTANCDEDAVFDLASLTKLLTTTFVLRLVAQNKASLDTTLLDMLPGWETAKAQPGLTTLRRLNQITLRQALRHCTGLPAWYPFYTGAGFWPTLETLLQSTPPLPGTLYSDLNFILLGKAAEALSGKSLAAQLAELNLALGTRFSYNPKTKAHCVPTEFGNRQEMHMCEERNLAFAGWRSTDAQIQGEANDGNAFYAFGGVSGHAGVFGTVGDVLLLGEMFLNSARNNNSYLPQPLMLEALSDDGTGRGLGFDTGEVFAHGAGHTGFTGTALWVCPSQNMAAALMASRLALPGPPNLQPLRKQTFALLHQMAQVAP